MKTIRVKSPFKKGINVTFYDSINEMPIARFIELQKMLVQMSGVGDDMQAIGARFSNLHRFLKGKDFDNAMKEASNLHNTFYFMMNNINLSSYAMLAFVHKIDGVEVDIQNPEPTIEIIKKISVADVEELINSVKKKLMTNFEPLFLIDLMSS